MDSPPDLGFAARRLGDDAAVLCRLLDPRGPGPKAVLAVAPRRDGLLRRWSRDARTARALPVAAWRLREVGLLAALSSGDRAVAEAALAWGEARAREIARLAKDVAASAGATGSRVLLCKAAGLHGTLYADPAARPAADVDAFVPREDVAALHDALVERGFVPSRGTPERVASLRVATDASLADLEYVGPGGVHLEVKADPVAMGMPLAKTDRLAERRRPSPCYAGLLVPSAEVMVLQQAFSLARRTAVDVLAHAELAGVLARAGRNLDTAWLVALLEGEGLDGVLRSVLSDVDRLFPGAIPTRLLARDGRPSGVVPARIRGALVPRRRARWDAAAVWVARGLSTRRPRDFARWLTRRAFPPTPLLAALASDPSSARGLRTLRRWRLHLGDAEGRSG